MANLRLSKEPISNLLALCRNGLRKISFVSGPYGLAAVQEPQAVPRLCVKRHTSFPPLPFIPFRDFMINAGQICIVTAGFWPLRFAKVVN
jgi:hypothetical protein